MMQKKKNGRPSKYLKWTIEISISRKEIAELHYCLRHSDIEALLEEEIEERGIEGTKVKVVDAPSKKEIREIQKEYFTKD